MSHQNTRGFLGIDESNHGRIPEIIVGAWSADPDDIVEIDGSVLGIEKNKYHKADIESILSDREFRYIVVDDDYKKFSYERRLLMAVSEFIRFFEGSEEVIIDGTVQGNVLKEMERISNVAPIRGIPQADKKYRLVCLADYVAGLIRGDMLHGKGSHDKYVKWKLNPDTNLYRNYVFQKDENVLGCCSWTDPQIHGSIMETPERIPKDIYINNSYLTKLRNTHPNYRGI